MISAMTGDDPLPLPFLQAFLQTGDIAPPARPGYIASMAGRTSWI
jgi:hypothetical protein